jgi:hypothetical protein
VSVGGLEPAPVPGRDLTFPGSWGGGLAGGCRCGLDRVASASDWSGHSATRGRADVSVVAALRSGVLPGDAIADDVESGQGLLPDGGVRLGLAYVGQQGHEGDFNNLMTFARRYGACRAAEPGSRDRVGGVRHAVRDRAGLGRLAGRARSGGGADRGRSARRTGGRRAVPPCRAERRRLGRPSAFRTHRMAVDDPRATLPRRERERERCHSRVLLTTSATSMLSRVALEYGQTWWAVLTSSTACSPVIDGVRGFSQLGTEPFRVGAIGGKPSLEPVARLERVLLLPSLKDARGPFVVVCRPRRPGDPATGEWDGTSAGTA